MAERKKRVLKLIGTGSILLVILYIISSSQYLYWGLLSIVKSAPDVIALQYNLLTPPATTTRLGLLGIEFTVPWSEMRNSHVTPEKGTAYWKFTDTVLVSLWVSTSTTKSMWGATPGINKIIPLNSLSDYDVEKMVWEIRRENIPLWATKNNDAIRDAMLGSMKATKYSWCGKLLEFQNHYGVRGVICDQPEGADWTSIVYFYPHDGIEYKLMIKPNQGLIRDSIIASIRPK
jgi:hypothetical protein